MDGVVIVHAATIAHAGMIVHAAMIAHAITGETEHQPMESRPATGGFLVPVHRSGHARPA
jgi:hypothetical protein